MATYHGKPAFEKSGYDVEYGHPPPHEISHGAHDRHHSSIMPDESGAVRGEVFTTGNSTYAKIQRFATRFGVEARGIERVPEDERTDKSTVKVGTMVCSLYLLNMPPYGVTGTVG